MRHADDLPRRIMELTAPCRSRLLPIIRRAGGGCQRGARW
jgi:hypothetical protein